MRVVQRDIHLDCGWWTIRRRYVGPVELLYKRVTRFSQRIWFPAQIAKLERCPKLVPSWRRNSVKEKRSFVVNPRIFRDWRRKVQACIVYRDVRRKRFRPCLGWMRIADGSRVGIHNGRKRAVVNPRALVYLLVRLTGWSWVVESTISVGTGTRHRVTNTDRREVQGALATGHVGNATTEPRTRVGQAALVIRVVVYRPARDETWKVQPCFVVRYRVEHIANLDIRPSGWWLVVIRAAKGWESSRYLIPYRRDLRHATDDGSRLVVILVALICVQFGEL